MNVVTGDIISGENETIEGYALLNFEVASFSSFRDNKKIISWRLWGKLKVDIEATALSWENMNRPGSRIGHVLPSTLGWNLLLGLLWKFFFRIRFSWHLFHSHFCNKFHHVQDGLDGQAMRTTMPPQSRQIELYCPFIAPLIRHFHGSTIRRVELKSFELQNSVSQASNDAYEWNDQDSSFWNSTGSSLSPAPRSKKQSQPLEEL